MHHDYHRKWAFFLPNVFTALNMACGFSAMMFASQGFYYRACMLILLGALFDLVDGRVARMTGTQSAFGEQFDSMSDLISFGMAPAMIFYDRFLVTLDRTGMVLTFLFVLCGALRLARFNANIDRVSSSYFQGLPIPSGALGLIGLVLLSTMFDMNMVWTYGAAVYILVYAILMISVIPFPSFKKSDYVKRHKKQVLMFIFVVITSLFIREELMLFVWISLYVTMSMGYYMTHKGQLKDVFEWKNDDGPSDEESN